MSRSSQPSLADDEQACCCYCGLPTSASTLPTRPRVRLYCCYGCRVADSILGGAGDADGAVEGSESDAAWQLTRLGLAVFFSMNVMVLALAQWSWDLYPDASLQSPRAQSLLELLRATSMLLSLVVFMLLGVSLAHNALQQLLQRRFTTDLLVVLGVGGALAYSAIAVFTGARHTYFEVSCMVLVAMTLGRWLEATGKLKTTSALRSLQNLLPQEVRRRKLVGGAGLEPTVADFERIPLSEVSVGDWIRVLPGERLPVDGVIVHGRAAVDEMFMTGESQPVTRAAGDSVYAGTRNEDGDLVMRVTAPPHGGALQRIVDAVVEAALRRSKLQTLADRIASWLTPIVVALAVAALLYHWATGQLGPALMTSLSVLLIACPCALGVATPLAVWTAMGRASEAGVLFRSGDAIQQLASADHFCFDKTGTLTTGEAVVDRWLLQTDDGATTLLGDAQLHGSRQKSRDLNAVRAAASASNHPLARALQRSLGPTSPLLSATLAKTAPGDGVVLDDESLGEIRLGRLEWMTGDGWRVAASILAELRDARERGQPTVAWGWSKEVRGLCVLTEELRTDAKHALAQLRQRGGVTVLTGDVSLRAEMLVAEVACGAREPIDVRAGLHPKQKQEAVDAIQAAGSVVAMVGDGVNDAPALAAADVGVAMGCGADVARDSADVCLLGDSLSRLVWATQLSRRTMQVVRQNLAWAFAYNGLGMAVAVCGQLNPIVAAGAMVGSSLLVIANSLRLSSFPLPFETLAPSDEPSASAPPKETPSTLPAELDMAAGARS